MSPHQRGQHKKTLGGNLLFNRDSIKGLKLRHFGKLNSTYSNKLWQPHLVHCGSYIYSCYAAVDERLIFALVFCGSSTAAHLLRQLYMTSFRSRKGMRNQSCLLRRLVYCCSSEVEEERCSLSLCIRSLFNTPTISFICCNVLFKFIQKLNSLSI